MKPLLAAALLAAILPPSLPAVGADLAPPASSDLRLAYLHYLAAGRFEEGAAFLDFMHKLLPTFRKFAGKFYETPGAATIDGESGRRTLFLNGKAVTTDG